MEMNKLDLNRLLLFLTIAETGGVSAAARRLALTRSAVSHSLGVLEADLGVALFHRVGRSLLLSNEGRLLQRAVRDASQRLGAALEDVLGLAREVRGAVRIGLFLGFSRFRLAGAIEALLRDHPAARVRVSFGPQAWLMDELGAGRLDMALSLRPTREQTPRIRSEKLSAWPLVLAIRRTSKKPPSEFAEICRLPIVDYYQSDPLIDRWTRHHFGGRRIPRERIGAWAASTDLVLELVRQGVGAAVLPEDLVKPFVRRRELAVIRGSDRALSDHLWLSELRGARSGRAAAAFRERLLEGLAGR